MNIGKRIRQLRVRSDLTQEELASRCELTKGFLSQLENDNTQPSLSTLEDIVEALGVTMSQFFSEDKDEKTVFGAEDWFVDEKDGAETDWIVPNAQKNDMEPIILKLQPGAQSQTVTPNKGEEFGYVLAGRVVLVTGTQRQHIAKGEAFYIDGRRTHYIKNESAKAASLIWVCTPPLF